MFNTLEKLRQKPESVKKQIAFAVALSFAGIIFLVWLTVVYPDLRKEKTQNDKLNNLEKIPVTSFTETFSGRFSGIVGEFKKVKELISSFKIGPEYYRATTTETAVLSSTTEDKSL